MMNNETRAVAGDGASPPDEGRMIAVRPRRRIVPVQRPSVPSPIDAAASPADHRHDYEVGYKKPPLAGRFAA